MIDELENVFTNRIKKLNVQKSLKRLRPGKDLVFLAKEFQSWVKKKGIIHEPFPSYSLKSKRRPGRIDSTLMDMTRTILADIDDNPVMQRCGHHPTRVL